MVYLVTTRSEVTKIVRSYIVVEDEKSLAIKRVEDSIREYNPDGEYVIATSAGQRNEALQLNHRGIVGTAFIIADDSDFDTPSLEVEADFEAMEVSSFQNPLPDAREEDF